MDERIPNRMVETFVLVFLALVYGGLLVLYGVEYALGAAYSLLFALVYGIYLLRHSMINGKLGNYKLVYVGLPIFELGILYFIFQEPSKIATAILMVFVTDYVLCYPKRFSLVFAYIGYLVYFAALPRRIMGEFLFVDIWEVLLNAIGYSFMLGAVIIAKAQLVQSAVLRQVMTELEQKSDESKKMAVLLERNRIAGDMHDTVGHALTTALIEMEASRLLIHSDPEVAYDKLMLAKAQAKNALEQVRASVRQMKSDENNEDLKQRIESVVAETVALTGLKVELTLEDIQDLHSIQNKILLNSVREAITNALKHSLCTHLIISLTSIKNTVEITCINDMQTVHNSWKEGVVSTQIYGFGLNHMREQIESIGGLLETKILVGGYFELKIFAPLAQEREVQKQ